MVISSHPNLMAFLAIHRLKTVHAAAIELKITQAAATKRLQALESSLGVSLFVRSRRGMALTEEGGALLSLCQQAQDLEGQFFQNIRGESRAEVSLSILGPTTAISTRIASDCAPLYGRYPFLRLHLRSDDHSNLVEMLRRGEGDLAVVSPSVVPNGMESKMLRPDRYILVGAPSLKGRPFREVLKAERILDFSEGDRMTSAYLAKFRLERHVGKTRIFVNENEALIRYLKAGVGIATLAESVALPFLARKDIVALNEGRVFEDALALVWLKRSRRLSYFDDLVRSIK